MDTLNISATTSSSRRYQANDPALKDQEVVISRDFDQLENHAKALAAELAALKASTLVMDAQAPLNERMLAAGMLTVDDLLAGQPLDRFMTHAAVNSLETYLQWLESRRKECLSLQAKLTLENREDDELFPWALAHASAFSEAHLNFKAACVGNMQTQNPNLILQAQHQDVGPSPAPAPETPAPSQPTPSEFADGKLIALSTHALFEGPRDDGKRDMILIAHAEDNEAKRFSVRGSSESKVRVQIPGEFFSKELALQKLCPGHKLLISTELGNVPVVVIEVKPLLKSV